MSGDTDTDTHHENSGGRDRRALAVSGAVAPARAVLVLSMAMLVMAVTWLFYSAGRPRAASRPYRSGRLLTVDRPFPAEGRFAGDPYVGSKIRGLSSGGGRSCTRVPGMRRPSGQQAGAKFPGADGTTSRTREARASPGAIDIAMASCTCSAVRQARSRNASLNMRSGRAITPRLS